MITTFANSAWLATCLTEYARFRHALNFVQEEQTDILTAMLRRNESTEIGRAHEFSKIRGARDYQKRVPLSGFEDYRGAIDRIANGLRGVLTKDPVTLFQPTSGSSGATKWIPYTHSLQVQFQRGIRAWVADMFLRTPDFLNGPAYWSVSPTGMDEQTTPSGIRVGFADDSEYLGGFQRRLVQSIMAVPPQIRKVSDPDRFWYTTLLHLIRRRDLRLVSVWSPSFLTLLVNRLDEYGERLARKVPEVKAALLVAAPERHVRLWPHLRTISCWTDGNCRGAGEHLARLFPQAQIEGKGLIATEGLVSFPFDRAVADRGHALSVRSHFFEFLPTSNDDQPDVERPQLAHELDRGGQYSVVLSTGGGLYRYQLGDRILVVGHERQCPLIRFVGRDQVVDWCGEKLHEVHVARVLSSTFHNAGITPEFAMLACDTAARVPNYVLYLECSAREERLRPIATEIENGLQENFHYSYARRIGQLGRLRIFAVQDAQASYLTACTERGQSPGNIKPVSLDRFGNWTSTFQGQFIETDCAAEVAS